MNNNEMAENNAFNNDSSKLVLHIEIIQSNASVLRKKNLIEAVDHFIQNEKSLATGTTLTTNKIPPTLVPHVAQIQICEVESSDQQHVNVCDIMPVYYAYKLEDEGPSVEDMGGAENEDVPAATHWLLPCTEFHNQWDNLIYDSNIKNQLLNFVSTTLLFSDCGVNSNIISWNRVLLLHGPPGTGKTSLCKALSQKLAIRLGDRYKYGQLFEVNSHSLFSKWFSESGKLVQKLFSKIMELVEDPQSLVCILIDEVESLTRARASGTSDPGDAMRVVNAILTQIDQIKRYPNVLILTTSNVSGTIDLAFVDRADIKQYIGLPTQAATYQIYHSCISELIRCKIVADNRNLLLTLRELRVTNMTVCELTKPSLDLWNIAGESVGLSGRTLRKIPFLAHALHCKSVSNSPQSLAPFMEAMRAAVQKHKNDDRLVTGKENE